MRQAYNGSASMRYQTLPVIHYGSTATSQFTPPSRFNVLECAVPMCRVGDLFMIEGQFCVTNDLPYSVEIARRLIFAEVSDAIDGDIVTRESGHNVSPQVDPQGNVWHGMHHGMFTFTGMYQISRAVPATCYFALVVYAGGSSYTVPTDTVKLEQSQGQIKWIRLN